MAAAGVLAINPDIVDPDQYSIQVGLSPHNVAPKTFTPQWPWPKQYLTTQPTQPTQETHEKEDPTPATQELHLEGTFFIIFHHFSIFFHIFPKTL